MAKASLGLLLGLAGVALALGITFVIPACVYQDAKKRGMNAWLWALVALIVPGFVGPLIYLIVRGQESAYRCPNCDQKVSKGYVHCPHCGEKLREDCAFCNRPLEPGWSRCAYCGETVPEYARFYDVVPEEKDDQLKKIIILFAIILAVVFGLALLIGLFNFTSFREVPAPIMREIIP